MAKTISAGISAELASTGYISADLIEFELDTPLYLTNSIADVTTSTATSGGTQTYLAQGDFMGFSSLGETSELRVNNVEINFTGATPTYVNIALSGNYLHRQLRIYRVWFDKTTLAQIESPLLIYDGTITGASVRDTASDTVVNFATSNQFYDFVRSAGRKTNDGSQRKFYTADRGMQYSTDTVSDILWGRL